MNHTSSVQFQQKMMKGSNQNTCQVYWNRPTPAAPPDRPAGSTDLRKPFQPFSSAFGNKLFDTIGI